MSPKGPKYTDTTVSGWCCLLSALALVGIRGDVAHGLDGFQGKRAVTNRKRSKGSYLSNMNRASKKAIDQYICHLVQGNYGRQIPGHNGRTISSLSGGGSEWKKK